MSLRGPMLRGANPLRGGDQRESGGNSGDGAGRRWTPRHVDHVAFSSTSNSSPSVEHFSSPLVSLPPMGCCGCCGDCVHVYCCEAIVLEDIGVARMGKGLCREAERGSISFLVGVLLERLGSLLNRLDFRAMMLLSLIRLLVTTVIVARGAANNNGLGPIPSSPRVVKAWEMRRTEEVLSGYSSVTLGMHDGSGNEFPVKLYKYAMTGEYVSVTEDDKCDDFDVERFLTYAPANVAYATSGCEMSLANAVVPIRDDGGSINRDLEPYVAGFALQVFDSNDASKCVGEYPYYPFPWIRSPPPPPTGNNSAIPFSNVSAPTVVNPLTLPPLPASSSCMTLPRPQDDPPPEHVYVVASISTAGSPTEESAVALAGLILVATGLVPTLLLAAKAIFMPLTFCQWFGCVCSCHGDGSCECRSPNSTMCSDGRCCWIACCCRCCCHNKCYFCECPCARDCGCCQHCNWCDCCIPAYKYNSDLSNPNPTPESNQSHQLPSSIPEEEKEDDDQNDQSPPQHHPSALPPPPSPTNYRNESKSYLVDAAERICVGSRETSIARLSALYDRPWQRLNIFLLSYAAALIAAIPIQAQCTDDPVLKSSDSLLPLNAGLCPRSLQFCSWACFIDSNGFVGTSFGMCAVGTDGSLEGQTCNNYSFVATTRLILNLVLTGYLLFQFVAGHFIPARVNPRRVPPCCRCCLNPYSFYDARLEEEPPKYFPSEEMPMAPAPIGDDSDLVLANIQGVGDVSILVGSMPPSRVQDCCEFCHQRGTRLVEHEHVWAASMGQFAANVGFELILEFVFIALFDQDFFFDAFGSVTFQNVWAIVIAIFAQIPSAVFYGISEPKSFD